jgi:CDP-glycerol glycerophosphotransferase
VKVRTSLVWRRGGTLRRVVNRITRSAIQRGFRTICGPLLRYLPARRHAVVYGWPDDEGNAVETVRALGRRYRGTVYWLLRDLAYRGPYYAAQELSDAHRVVRVRKRSLRAYLLSLTAETTFYTHGLFNAVDPPDNRLVVNLWHGDGPKLAKDTHLFRSTVVVAGTALWGAQRMERFGVSRENVAVVGNPRVDQLTVGSRSEVLSRLGLDLDRRTILWLPTFRTGSADYGRTWSDADNLSGGAGVAELVESLSRAADEHSMQLVVKPHPLDADVYAVFDIDVLPHERLLEAGVPFYALLGAADAIISDVSSVWVDFLTLDRPIGFYIPDLEALQSDRGFNVEDVASLLPGPRIESALDAVRFVGDVATRPHEIRPSGYPGCARIGIVTGGRVADRLLDWLDDFQRARHRDPLFTR